MLLHRFLLLSVVIVSLPIPHALSAIKRKFTQLYVILIERHGKGA